MTGVDGEVSVRLSRLPRNTLLLGMSAGQLVAASFTVTVVIAALYTGGGRALLVAAPLWLTGLLIAAVPVAGRPIVEWLPLLAGWTFRGATGRRTWTITPTQHNTGAQGGGMLVLPGDAGSVRLLDDPTSGAVLIHDRDHARLVAVASVSHSAFVLLDPDEQARRVTAWGRVLAGACRSRRVARLQVLERALPDDTSSVADWWHIHGVDDGSWVARTYRQLIDRAGPASERHATHVAIALDLNAASREIRAAGRGLHGAGVVLRREMAALQRGLAAADLGPINWATRTELDALVRAGFDPTATPPTATTPAGPLVGSTALSEEWDRLRTEAGWHAVLWICQWPHATVRPDFLAPLLLAGGVRRTFSLVVEPVAAEVAARQVRRRRTAHMADAAQRAKAGQIDDAIAAAEHADVLAQEADLIAGHGMLRFTALLAVTAPTTDDLDAAIAEVTQTASQAGCDLRVLAGQQAAAFIAAALPLCKDTR